VAYFLGDHPVYPVAMVAASQVATGARSHSASHSRQVLSSHLVRRARNARDFAASLSRARGTKMFTTAVLLRADGRTDGTMVSSRCCRRFR